MAERTEIAWTDATWNPWHGCHKVSEACKNCYMFRERETRYTQMGDPTVVRRSKTKFNDPLRWGNNLEKYGNIRRIFTCSWSDWFIEEADAWRNEAWDIIRRTPFFTYQILTKRPERIASCLPKDWNTPSIYNNVWLGVTVENQSHAAERVWTLLKTPAARRFVSIEPMLGPVDLDAIEALCKTWRRGFTIGVYLDWVICGCESGPGARETQLDWVRNLRDECVLSGVPFFLKQLMIGGKLVTTPELDGRRWTEFPQ